MQLTATYTTDQVVTLYIRCQPIHIKGLADHIKYCMVNNTNLQYMHTVSPKLGFVRFIYFW